MGAGRSADTSRPQVFLGLRADTWVLVVIVAVELACIVGALVIGEADFNHKKSLSETCGALVSRSTGLTLGLWAAIIVSSLTIPVSVIFPIYQARRRRWLPLDAAVNSAFLLVGGFVATLVAVWMLMDSAPYTVPCFG